MFSDEEQTEFILSTLKEDDLCLKKNALTDSQKLDSVSAESVIYLDKEEKNLYKVSKDEYTYDSLIRSFYIGRELNKIRILVPNFVLTKYVNPNQPEPYVSYQYVKGDTLDKVIHSLTFPEFLNVFIQLLFALELAQKHCMFCHYDLHLSNVLMKVNPEPYSYDVLFDNFKYTVKVGRYTPIIIDFGFASSFIKGRLYGATDYENCGIYTYPLPGVDMYKFLFHSYMVTKGAMQRQIGGLLHFYGTFDPYKILLSSESNLRLAGKSYLSKVSDSYISTFTPFQFAKWVMDEYPVDVSRTERDLYFTTSIKPRKVLNMPSTTSYIVNSYIKKVCGKEVPLNEELLENDNAIMRNYSLLKVPNEKEVIQSSNSILFCDDMECVKDAELKVFRKASKFARSVSPYLQYLYTIRELRLNELYETFLNEFVASEQFEMYNKICFIVDKTNRWLKTLNLKQKLII